MRHRAKNIADVLAMTVEEAEEFFSAIPEIHRKMPTLLDVWLGFIKLGQPATPRSGGGGWPGSPTGSPRS